MVLGLHTYSLQLKHGVTFKAAILEPFDGVPKNVGLKARFDIKVGEDTWPQNVDEAAWPQDPNGFITFWRYVEISLFQVKVGGEIFAPFAALDDVHGGHHPSAKHYSSEQHCSWTNVVIKTSITVTVQQAFEAYEDDHCREDVLLYLYLLHWFMVPPESPLFYLKNLFQLFAPPDSSFPTSTMMWKPLQFIVTFILETFSVLEARLLTAIGSEFESH